MHYPAFVRGDVLTVEPDASSGHRTYMHGIRTLDSHAVARRAAPRPALLGDPS